ncbi:MAG: hypothetical protein ACI4K5_06430, partial [Ruminococcus sp.]
LSAYSDISKVDFIFDCTPVNGMSGCAVFGNWEYQNNYDTSSLVNNTLTITLDKKYNSMTLHKWYGDVNLKSVVLYKKGSEPTTTTTTTTTAKPTTTTTTTTTTAKPTTTTTTTTTTAKPTTTTTTTTTTAKPTTTTTTTTTTQSAGNTAVITDIESGKEYSLADYNPSAVKEITIQLDGEVGYGFGGKLVLGNWAVQLDFGHADMNADKTVTFKIDNPQDKITIYNYWGNMTVKSVTLVY